MKYSLQFFFGEKGKEIESFPLKGPHFFCRDERLRELSLSLSMNTNFLPSLGSPQRPRTDPVDRVQVQNQRRQHPVPLPQVKVGHPRQGRRRDAEVLLQRGLVPHAGNENKT